MGKGKTKRLLKYKNQLTKHHIIPSSRGGKSLESNICMVPRYKHEQYHILFGNRVPEEIIDYLVRDFWGNRIDYVQKYLNERDLY